MRRNVTAYELYKALDDLLDWEMHQNNDPDEPCWARARTLVAEFEDWNLISKEEK